MLFLARVELNDELLVHHRVDFLAGRNAHNLATKSLLIDKKPIRCINDLSLIQTTLGEALGAILFADSDNITNLECRRGDIALAAVHSNVAVGNHLTGSRTGLSKAHAVNDVVKAPLKKLEKDESGDSTGLQSGLEVAAELALKNTILETKLLLLSKRGAILGNLASRALRTVHAGRIRLMLESTC
jgi:hypothetical protein